MSADVVIINAFEGEGKYRGSLGGIVVLHGNVSVKVGGGFSDLQRQEFWEVWNNCRNSLEGRLVEVEYHEETPDGSLRHPRFIRFRDDK